MAIVNIARTAETNNINNMVKQNSTRFLNKVFYYGFNKVGFVANVGRFWNEINNIIRRLGSFFIMRICDDNSFGNLFQIGIGRANFVCFRESEINFEATMKRDESDKLNQRYSEIKEIQNMWVKLYTSQFYNLNR